ncbi:Protein UGT-54, partial [Aphelenchoides avenae]
MDNDAVLDFLRAQHYDVALSETWHVCPFSLFHLLNIPTRLGTAAVPLSSMLADRFGIPSPVSTTPFLFAATISGDDMTYRERVRNALIRSLLWASGNKLVDKVDAMMREKHGNDFPGALDLIKNVSLAFVNANPFFDIPRPISHKTVHIGGVVEKTPKPLSKNLQAIFSSAKRGVVLFSFGSVTDNSKMSTAMKMSFLKAFARLGDYQFIWKYRMSENDRQLFAKFPNVHPTEWVDQVSVL